MTELTRILKSGAILKVVVPHFSNPYFYSDYTHRSFFGLYTFCYLTNNTMFKRKVPHYDVVLNMSINQVKLIFKSFRPFYFRWGLKRLLQAIFNLNVYTMEFYEENLCYIFPCYEIEYTLTRD